MRRSAWRSLSAVSKGDDFDEKYPLEWTEVAEKELRGKHPAAPAARARLRAAKPRPRASTLESDLLLDIMPSGAVRISRRQPCGVARDGRDVDGIDAPSPAREKG